MLRLNASKPKTWKDWFLANPTNHIVNHSNKKKLFDNFNSTVDNTECKRRLLESEETLFLCKQNFGARICSFHHLKRSGGNFYDNIEIFGAIQGIDQDATSIISPDISVLLGTPSSGEEKVPPIADLLIAKTRSDIENLKVSDTETYLPRNFIPVPPFLYEATSEAIDRSGGCIVAVLLQVIEEILEFDDIDGDDESENLPEENAKTSCEELLYWLYLAHKAKVYATPSVGCSNRVLNKKFQALTEMELSSTDGSTN